MISKVLTAAALATTLAATSALADVDFVALVNNTPGAPRTKHIDAQLAPACCCCPQSCATVAVNPNPALWQLGSPRANNAQAEVIAPVVVPANNSQPEPDLAVVVQNEPGAPRTKCDPSMRVAQVATLD